MSLPSLVGKSLYVGRMVGRGRGRSGGRIAGAAVVRGEGAVYVAEALEGRVLLATIYVDAGAGGTVQDGTSWGAAFVDLQAGLGAAVSGDQIRVAKGVYNPTQGTDRTISFVLKSGVELIGGYAGAANAENPDARDIALYPSVLSGDIGVAGDKSDNSYHIVVGSNTDATAVLDGFTVTGGNASGTYPDSAGGGMYIKSGSPTIRNSVFSENLAGNGGGVNCESLSSPTLTNCTFSKNSVGNRGGGMYSGSSSPTLTNCTFSGNSATATYSYGAGMYSIQSSPILTNCSFTGNSAPGANSSGGGMSNCSRSAPTLVNCTFSKNVGAWGAGLYNEFLSSATLTNCSFSQNSASTSGGGMRNLASSPTLTNCSFTGNSTTGNSSTGGGMDNDGSSPIVTNCTFTANSAKGSGGGMGNEARSSPTLTNCNFSGNSARSAGGGMLNDWSLPTLSNCSFSGNSASSGGGMYNRYSSSPILTNCTFSGNSAQGSGGGMYNYNSCSPTLTNCTFSGNSASESGGVSNNDRSSPTLGNCIMWGNTSGITNTTNSVPKVTYSDVQGGYTGTGNIDADPLFVRSPWTGPDGVFGTADDDFGDLRLRAGSPALDIGINAAVVGVDTDLGGNARIQNGTVDLGAYEGATVSNPRILYVDLTAVGANSGTSWGDAFTSLQSALAAAVDGDTIRVADGTYKPTSTSDRTLSFALRNDVSIYGGYAGYGAADPDDRDPVAYPTILSGDIGVAGNHNDNSYHVVTATGVGSLAVLDGICVTGGDASGSGLNQKYGSGLFLTASSPTLINCSISRNWGASSSGSSSGAGMYNYYSSPTVINCTFSGNMVNGSGGGIYNSYSSPTLSDCSFIGNSAWNGGGMYDDSSSPKLTDCSFSDNSGSGMYNKSSSPTLTNCSFVGNTADSGGGMCNYQSSSPTLNNCTFSGNSAHAASNYGSGGGGMYNASKSSPTLSNCTFIGNSSKDGTYASGGGMYNKSGSPTVINCSFIGNVATDATYGGGGMYNDSALPTLIGCIFVGNSASHGGGMYNSSSSVTLTGCTLVGNSAKGGGALYNMAKLTSSIVWGNSSAISGGTGGVTYSDIQDDFPGAGNVNADPMFVRNPSAGPDGQWGTADDDYGDLRLQSGSPCIDAGNNSAVPSGVTRDLAGNPRFMDVKGQADTGKGTPPIVDMGAYEAVDAVNSIVASGKMQVGIGESRSLELLRVDDQAKVEIAVGARAVVRVGNLIMNGEGVVDVNDNGLVIGNESVEAIGSLVGSGKRDGVGIVSSAAKERAFVGLGVGVNDGGEVVVKYTWDGDANLDGVVNAADYFMIDSNFIPQAKGYQNGDFNYDGVINADDYFLIDSAFLGQTGQLATKPPAVGTPVGEGAEESGEDTLVLRASRPNGGVFATRDGDWLRDLVGGEESVLGAAE